MKKVLKTMFNFGTIAGLAVMMMGSISMAKVADFKSLIVDNISAQNELHGEVKKQIQVTRESLNPGPAETMVVESDQTQFNAPTAKRMLKFSKETSMKNASHKKQMDRVSQELNDASTSF